MESPEILDIIQEVLTLVLPHSFSSHSDKKVKEEADSVKSVSQED